MTSGAILTVVSTLAVASLFLLSVVLVVWWFDRYDREPLPLVAGVFLWGAVVVPGLLVMTADAAAAALGGPPFGDGMAAVTVFGPFVEEAFKGLGILLVVLFSSHFDNPTDGLVYGTAVGLGFATTENLVVGFSTVSAFGDGAWMDTVVSRTLLTAGVHAVASAVLGAGFGFAVLCGKIWERWLWVFGGMVSAIALHGAWNWFVVSFPVGVSGVEPWMLIVPLYVVFAGFLAALLGAEHRILIRQLTEEVELGVVPEWTVKIIPYYRRRIRSDWWPRRQERTIITRLLTKIAFRKHAIANGGTGPESLEGLEVVRLREQIRAMLQPVEPTDTFDDPRHL